MVAAFEHVLVATDGSPMADKALELALRVANGSRVTALTVVHDYGLPEYLHAAVRGRPDAQLLREELLAEGRRLLGDAVARVARDNTPVEQQVVLSGKAPCHEIVAAASRQGCDLIVMSSHGLGGRMAGLLGSQTQAVLSLAAVPVLVTR
ncbi:MAG TPA: universal stress protein [Roseateles sp.]